MNDFKHKILWVCFGFYLVAALADATTTVLAISRGSTELNPFIAALLRTHPATMWAFKLLVVPAVVCLVVRALPLKCGGLVALGLIQLGAAIYNTSVMAHRTTLKLSAAMTSTTAAATKHSFSFNFVTIPSYRSKQTDRKG